MTEILARGGFRFSPGGSWVACLADDDAGRQHLETWRLTSGGPWLDRRVPVRCEPAQTQLVMLDDGRVLLSWHEPGVQRIDLVDATGERRPLGGSAVPLRLLAGAVQPGGLAVAIGRMTDGVTTIHQIVDGPSGGCLVPVAELPGRVGGTVVVGDRLVVTAALDGPARPIRLDARTGGGRPLASSGHALLAGGGRILLAVGRRLALAPIHADADVQPLDVRAEGSAVTPVAVDPAGESVALVVTRGARSELVLHDVAGGETTPVRGPVGVLVPVAAWTESGLWLPVSTPDSPASLGWCPDRRTLRIQESARGPGHDARLESIAGVEAVVYGPDRRANPRVVIALHGGPDARWDLGYDPLLRSFAEAGLTVIAPNQRGSTGYGSAHATAIHGAWGGPDLADVLAIAASLATRPALFGTSYGAFLALLAAAAEPETWTRCVAVAPFRSAEALYAEGTPAVRALVDRMRARQPIADELGPRDLDRLAERIRIPVLIVHGELDETVPVGQSREIVRRLGSAGHAPVTYRELPHRGHLALGYQPGDPMLAEVTTFLGARDEIEGR